MTQVNYLTSLSHPKARPYMHIHPIMNHTPSLPVIHSDLIRRRNFRFPFPMKNVFTPRILIWCSYKAFYYNGSYENPIIEQFESFWPWSSNAMYVLRPSQGNTILRDTKIQSTTMINNSPVQNVTSNLIGRINT